MLRSAKRKAGVVQGGVGGSLGGTSCRLSKVAVAGTGDVGDIEDLPSFALHKASMHQFSENEVLGVRNKLLEVFIKFKDTHLAGLIKELLVVR